MAKIPKSSRQVTSSGRVAGGQVPFDIANTGQGLEAIAIAEGKGLEAKAVAEGKGLEAQGLANLGKGVTDVGNVLFELKQRKDTATNLTQSGLDQQAQQAAENQIDIAETGVSINDRTSEYYEQQYNSRFKFNADDYGTKQGAEIAEINFNSRREGYISGKGIKNAQLAVKSAVQLTEQNYITQPTPENRVKYAEALSLQDTEDGVTFKLNQADMAAAKLTKANNIGVATQAGLTAWQSTVTIDDPDGDLNAGLDLINGSDLPAEDKPAAETALKTMVTNRRAEAKLELEGRQEDSRDEINKALFEDKDYGASDALIAGSPLDEKEQTTFFKLSEQRAQAAAKGTFIKNDRVEENRLYNMSLGIWNGSVTKKEFDEELLKNASKLDDAAYTRVSTSAATTLKTSQSQSMTRASTEARQQLVDFQSEDAFDKFIADSIAGLSPKASDAFTNKANEIRQEQFRELSNYNAEMRDWVAENPDKTGKDFFVRSRELENEYKLAKTAGNTVEELRAIKPDVAETTVMISPEGKPFTVPVANKQIFLDNGYLEQ